MLPRCAAQADVFAGYGVAAGTGVLVFPVPQAPGARPPARPGAVQSGALPSHPLGGSKTRSPGKPPPVRHRAPGPPGPQFAPFGIGPRARLGPQFTPREPTVLLEHLLPAPAPPSSAPPRPRPPTASPSAPPAGRPPPGPTRSRSVPAEENPWTARGRYGTLRFPTPVRKAGLDGNARIAQEFTGQGAGAPRTSLLRTGVGPAPAADGARDAARRRWATSASTTSRR